MDLKPKKSAKESVETTKLEAEKAELINDLQRTRADFENFRKHNIPENWNDEIGGTFQLLNSHPKPSFPIRLICCGFLK